MLPEQNIAKFLEIFNKDDRIHRKTYEMLTESYADQKGLRDLIASLVKSGVNAANLKEILIPEDEIEKCEIVVENSERIREKFRRFKCNEDIEPFRPDDVKRIRVEESNESGLPGIPGLCPEEISFEHQNEDPQPEKTPQINTRPQSRNKEDKQASNKKLQNDTVFYENILQISKEKPNLSVDRDPYYLFPVLQCKLCGLRFSKQQSDIFGQHIEDHRRFTNALSERNVLRREFFYSGIVQKVEKLELPVESGIEEIVWEKESPMCTVCGKIIRKKWDDEIENWILEDAAKIGEKEVAHKKCVY